MSSLSALDEFDRLCNRSTAEFTNRILDLAEEHARPIPRPLSIVNARERLGLLIAGTYSVAEMLGRRRVRMEADKVKAGVASYDAMRYAAEEQNFIPNVSPERAIKDLLSRDPRLVRGYREVQVIYSRERAFALAKAADRVVAERVRDFEAAALHAGLGLPAAEKVIAALGDWARAYGETVHRTNTGTAYASGRMKEAADPDLDGFIVGLERLAVLDPDCRKNHRAAHGLCAGQRDPIWLRLGLPAGYNCRCMWRLIDIFEARRRHLMDGPVMRRASTPPGAYNDEGFTDRASFSLYGL